MNIAFIIKERLSFDEAAPSRVLNLKKFLESNGEHKIFIVCQKSDKEISENICSVPKIGNGFIAHQVFKLIQFFILLHLIFIKKVRFIIIRQYYFVIMLYPFAKITGTKLLYDMHCFRYKELKYAGKIVKGIISQPFEKLAHWLADRILVINDSIIESFPVGLHKKTIMLPNGVDNEPFQKRKSKAQLLKILKKYKIPIDKPLIGFLGNWMEWADVPTFLNASKYVRNATFVVIGEGYDTKEYMELREKFPSVLFTGRIPHYDAINIVKSMAISVLAYKKTDVVKYLSIRKTAEYLAAGKPIIASSGEIKEWTFLKEHINILSYNCEDAKDLAKKIHYLLANKTLMAKISSNNKIASLNHGWDQVISRSPFIRLFNPYTLNPKMSVPLGKISIIIKTLNEEEHIAECIESALAALNGLTGEVILVDSKSMDRTIEIAKKYPIRIIQLKNMADRRCGVGPQTGYLFSKGDFIYMLDGDMRLDKNFLKKALPYLNYPEVAGVGGNILEKSQENLVFQLRSKDHQVKKLTLISHLGMGGLYKREAIENVGYFSDPSLYAYEEAEIGAQLCNKGYTMLRIPETMVYHHGDQTSPYETLMSKWKSNYLYGSGQYLHRSIIHSHLLKSLYELRIYIFTMIWQLAGIISVVVYHWFRIFMVVYLWTTLIFIFILLVHKRSITKLLFSIVSWNLQTLGMIIGLSLGVVSPLNYKPNVAILK